LNLNSNVIVKGISMKRIFPILLVLVAGVVGVGFYRGWFTVSSDRDVVTEKVDVHLSVDKAKIKEDVEEAEEKVKEEIDHIRGK